MLDLKLPGEFKAFVNPDSKLKYYSKNPLKAALIKRFFGKILGMIQEVNPREMIEIGCGDGIAGYLIRKNLPDLEYYPADVQTESLINASRILNIREMIKLDARVLPYPDKTFDLALFLEVFEHIEGWEKAFSEGLRIARKGLIFSVPAYPWFQLSRLIFLKNLSRMGEHPDHINQFPPGRTKQQIEMLCNQLKLKVNYGFVFPWLTGKIIF